MLLIGHRTPLEMVTGQGFPDAVLPEGAMAVFAPVGDGYRLLGTLSADALVAQRSSARESRRLPGVHLWLASCF